MIDFKSAHLMEIDTKAEDASNMDFPVAIRYDDGEDIIADLAGRGMDTSKTVTPIE